MNTNKEIVVEWKKEDSMYGRGLYVVSSTHSRFTPGSRFDFGFLEIATKEHGYSVTVLPYKQGE